MTSTETSVVRVYVPMTLTALAAAVPGGVVAARPVHAVTPALSAWYPGEEIEELELAALTDAAQTSLVRLADERADRGDAGEGGLASRARRVVLAADAAVLEPLTTEPPQAQPPQAQPPHALTADEGEAPGTSDGPVPGRATGLSVVALAADLLWSAVVSVHVDEEDAEPDVAAAVAALLADREAVPPRSSAGASSADPDEVLHAVEDAEACDLLWYAPSEVVGLLEDLARP